MIEFQCLVTNDYRDRIDAVAKEFGVPVETVDIDRDHVDGVLTVPTLDIIVGGELLKRIVRWYNVSALTREVEEVL